MYRHYRMINTETAPIEEAIPAKSEEEKEVGCLGNSTALSIKFYQTSIFWQYIYLRI